MIVVRPLSDCPRLRFDVLSIDFVRVTNCFYDYDYDYDLLDLAAKKAGLQQTFKHTQNGLTDKEKVS